jgi:hypothetical protein
MHNMHKQEDTVGTYQAHVGQFRLVPEKTCLKIEEAVNLSEDLVPASVVLNELSISKKTLRNLIAAGRISRRMYTVAVNGAKFFYNKMILGVKKCRA